MLMTWAFEHWLGAVHLQGFGQWVLGFVASRALDHEGQQITA